ncbi:MAG: macro domain-containing protein [Dehalococcoidia bacterium]
MNARTYSVGRSSITVRFGDITGSRAEVLVSSDDESLSMSGGVSGAIRRAAGERIRGEVARLVPAKAADVLVSSAGNLRAKYILHAITIEFSTYAPYGDG